MSTQPLTRPLAGRLPTRTGVLQGAITSALPLALLALGLRLIPALWGDISPGRDGMIRLDYAVQWARQPTWEGLSGVWPPVHWYVLGALIRVWDQPILLARLLNLACGVGSVLALRAAARPLFGSRVAGLSALLLALYWTHIWLTASYWVELPYLLFVFLAMRHASALLERSSQRDALLAGVYLGAAILLRHEGIVLLGLFAFWLLLNAPRRCLLVAMPLPAAIAAWHFVEAWLGGYSYFEYAFLVKEMKAGENLLQGVGLREALSQWVVMPAVTPSLFVVLPGLYGLWRGRRLLRRDLFAWLLMAQVGLYLAMTLTSTWRPQLRYVMLYVVNLLPYAALAWTDLADRLPKRPIIPALLALTIATQSFGWWVGRNHRDPIGWLPLEVITPAQAALDAYIGALDSPRNDGLRLVMIGPGPFEDAWNVDHSLLVRHTPAGRFDSREVYVPANPQVYGGELPDFVYAADMVFIDPAAPFTSAVLGAVGLRGTVETRAIHDGLVALLLSERGRQADP